MKTDLKDYLRKEYNYNEEVLLLLLICDKSSDDLYFYYQKRNSQIVEALRSHFNMTSVEISNFLRK